jgi:hypothetical protein
LRNGLLGRVAGTVEFKDRHLACQAKVLNKFN